MPIISKIVKLLEYPGIILAMNSGVKPIHAYYFETIKDATSLGFNTIIDVGANNGWYSEAAHYYHPNAKIYCFEPVPHRFDKLNSLPNVRAFSMGLWETDDIAEFNIPMNKDYDDGSSFLKLGDENFIHKELGDGEIGRVPYNKIEVERKRFDSLNIEINKPCLLKIDSEGSEIFVLKGFGDKLGQVDVVQVEISFQENFKDQTKVSEIIRYLEHYGFIGFIQRKLRYENGYPNHCDLIFIKKKD